MIAPDQFRPADPRELIGPARGIAEKAQRHARGCRDKAGARLRQIFYGLPGCGKTVIAGLAARELAGDRIDIESINGKNVSIDTVRDWQQSAAYGSLFGGWKVKLINELDLVPLFAQELMLTYLDELPARTAVIATSNATMDTLSERFATRFGCIKVDSPETKEVAAFLRKRWKIQRHAADFIAVGACGNVRDALLQASSYLVFGCLNERPKAPVIVKDSARVDAARRAWETMRNKKAVTA